MLSRCTIPMLSLLAPFLLASARPVPQTATPQHSSGVEAYTSAPSRRDHLRKLNVAAWQAAGHRGKGIKVAILDSGFSGYRRHLGEALPSRVRTHSLRHDGNLEAKDSQHGILCAEAIHAIAPDAELMLVNWEPSHPKRFLDAVRWAVAQGADIISCSIIMPTWSDGEGGGPIHAELARILGDGSRREHALFFACAGNTADRHWSGRFRDDGRGRHDWGAGIDNRLHPWGEGRVSVELCADRDADLDLVVVDRATGKELQRCRMQYGEHRTAVVRFDPQCGIEHAVRVQAHGPRTDASFHVFVLGGNLGSARAEGSIPFPGDGEEVVTVGAVETDLQRAPYSSCGPNSNRPKPDLAAVVPFGSCFRSRPFAGTSAAAPQAAGLAAVLWSARPLWSAASVKQHLLDAAQDLGPRGHDCETGYGLIRLPGVK